MPTQFYYDRGDADVAFLAQAICRANGNDPFALTPDNGYENAPLVPAWWKRQDFAAAFLACHRARAFAGSLATKADRTDPRWPLAVDVIDTISRLAGRVTAVTYHLHGQVDAFVEPRFREGTKRAGHWIPIDRLEAVQDTDHPTEPE